jgi:NADP-dependent aldehyde dehydrogenase
MAANLSGLSFLGFRRGAVGGRVIRAMNPTTRTALPELFHSALPAEVEDAVKLAQRAAPVFAAAPRAVRAAFLRSIAAGISEATPQLSARASLESALNEARCVSEIGRTMNQLRFFADICEKGEWTNPRIETAQPERQPTPRPDLRSMSVALGPVGVFCASNFPFAYSVAGGDTASAFAAGCPVVVMAHHAHPGTAELVAGIIDSAARRHALPDGTFSLLMGDGADIGQHLAKQPALSAIGFTGSRAGGRALMDTCAARAVPIPVYAEMSSVNPVVLLEGALCERADAIAAGLVNSCTQGLGQFCTQPGLHILVRSRAAEAFVDKVRSSSATSRCRLTLFVLMPAPQVSALFRAAADGVMLTAGICNSYVRSTETRNARSDVKLLATGSSSGQPGCATPALYSVSAKTFLSDASLHEEVFGPCSLVVWCDDLNELKTLLANLDGNLTATLHASAEEMSSVAPSLVPLLQANAGRLIMNGFPTGVEAVSHAIVRSSCLSPPLAHSLRSWLCRCTAAPIPRFPTAGQPLLVRTQFIDSLGSCVSKTSPIPFCRMSSRAAILCA